MRGIALHGLDEVRNEVPAPLQLDVDVGPRLTHALTQRDEAVVPTDDERDDQPDDDERDQDLHDVLP